MTRKEHVNWASVTSPPVNIDVDYIPLGSLFFVFAGVTPNKGQKAIQVCPEGIVCKLNWKLRWHEKGKLWANPGSVPQEKRWIKYGPNYLKRSAVESSHLLDLSKVLIGRDVNRGTVEPLRAHFDTVGLCPDRHLFCIVTVEESQKYNDVQYDTQRTPQGWGELSSDEKKLWVTGILSSELVNEISLIGRNSRGLSKDAICQFPLPTHINRQIIDITQEIISLEQKDNSELSIHDNYRELLNRLVEESYGNPTRVKVARTGKPLELEEWQNESKKQTRSALGQVLEVAVDEGQVCIYISRLMEDDNIEGEWMPLPQELPGWALDGTPFEAELSIDIKTFDKLRERPWALRRFRHTPRPYLTDEELDTFLKVPDLEVQP